MNTRPKLRGWFHQSAFFMALGASFSMLLPFDMSSVYITKLIYATTLCNLFAISALYHRITWQQQAWREFMRKLDHSAIFLLIAGSATALAFKGLNENSFFKFMFLIWGACILGIIQVIVLKRKNKFLASLVYIGTGGLALFYVPEFYHQLGLQKTIVILSGGAIYAIGGVIYGLKKPNPLPRYFGHHEIFHLMVVIAAFMHFSVISQSA